MDENMRNTDLEQRQKRRQEMLQRRKRQQLQRRRLLIIAVAALAVLLVAVLGIALLLGGGEEPNPTGPSGSGTTPSGSSGNPTVQTDAPKELTVLAPTKTQFTTMDEAVTLVGTSDPEAALTLNGQALERDETGMFNSDIPLQLGENVLTLSHREKTVELRITRLYATKAYFPSEDMTYCSKATVLLEVAAKTGSTVSAEFGGKKIDLTLCADQLGSGYGEGYTVYVGQYTLPSLEEDRDMGQIVYTITSDGITDTVTSGNILCKKSVEILDSDPSVTPTGDKYIDVGSGFIVEVVSKTAETLDGRTQDDNSSPLNNYLPKGTVDYASTTLVHNAKANQTYRVLRCGYRVYEAKNNYPAQNRDQIIMTYNGTLPDHNEIGFVSMEETGNFSILTLDAMWKAPFYFDIAPQEYTNPETRDFTFAEFTADHVDITFCYATVFTGDVKIPEDNPLFSSAEVIKNESDYTLRLHLKKVGGFYGWDAYYNEDDQLCFKFLNPAVVTPEDNAYGVNLSGVTVMVDVGHGNVDGGTVGYVGSKQYTEAGRNLALAQALKKELESIGATVVLNREGDEAVTVEERLAYLKEIAPDYCIAIHHNASTATNANGFEAFYFGPMSQLAATHLWAANRNSHVYNSSVIMWHYYHMARQSNCPVVLTENGYMTNAGDMFNTVDEVAIQKKAVALTQGIANYFLDINQ